MSEPAKHPAPWKWCEGEDEHDELQDLNGFEENALVDATWIQQNVSHTHAQAFARDMGLQWDLKHSGDKKP